MLNQLATIKKQALTISDEAEAIAVALDVLYSNVVDEGTSESTIKLFYRIEKRLNNIKKAATE